MTNKKIIVDIDVYNCQIRAAKPTADIHNAMPNDDARKKIWWDNVDLARINNTKYGTLSGNALKKARRIVNQNGGINISGEYGSIEIDEKEFHPFPSIEGKKED